MGVNRPTVSIVIPVRNEEKFLPQFLAALEAQTYGANIVEILFVDGSSTDDTRGVLEEFRSRLPSIRVIDNPERIVPPAMNRGIRVATGDIVVRLDAHTIPAPDYVERCVHHLEETQAWNVGGAMRAEGVGETGRAIALATTSPFGIGGSPFHYSTKPQYVDTVYLGAFPRWVFDKVGLYDERFVRNQDYELNHRIREAGGAIFLAPDIHIIYFPRSSFSALWRQYLQYGYWKVQTLRKHPGSLKWRQAVAPIFVAGIVAGPLMGWLWRPLLAVWLLGLLAYVTLASAFAWRRVRHEPDRWALLPKVVLTFAILHVAWGIGFWRGWLDVLLGQDPLS